MQCQPHISRFVLETRAGQTITTNFVNYIGSKCEISLLDVTLWVLAKRDIDSSQREQRVAGQLTVERSWGIGNWDDLQKGQRVKKPVGSEQLG